MNFLFSFLDDEMKNVMKERKVLENKRLDLDACKSKVKKSRKDIMEQRPVRLEKFEFLCVLCLVVYPDSW